MPVQVEQGEALVVALDPGTTTGLAVHRHSGLPAPLTETYAFGQVEGRFNFYDTFDGLVAWGYPLVVVCERFTVTGATAQKSPQLDPLYVIGAIERQCHKLGFPFELQTPAQAMAFSTDQKLKAAGWFTKGAPHANDAARHLMRFIIQKRADFGGKALLDRVVANLGIAS